MREDSGSTQTTGWQAYTPRVPPLWWPVSLLSFGYRQATPGGNNGAAWISVDGVQHDVAGSGNLDNDDQNFDTMRAGVIAVPGFSTLCASVGGK